MTRKVTTSRSDSGARDSSREVRLNRGETPGGTGFGRRAFLKTAVVGAVAGTAAASGHLSGTASAADIPATNSYFNIPGFKLRDYSNIPQRSHKYPASDRAIRIVKTSKTIDSLFSATWPEQWSSAEAPENRSKAKVSRSKKMTRSSRDQAKRSPKARSVPGTE